jgi:SAM-dependent methyltransferase
LRRLCSEPPPLALDAFRGLVVAAQYRYLYEATLRHVRPASRVLDWGCGDGHFSHFLLARGYRVDSFTLQDAPPLFERLPDSWRGRHTLTVGSPSEPTRLPFAGESFDAVFSVGVLEHVRETGGREADSLAEIHRVLRPGGLFLCFHLPNRWSLVEWMSRQLFRDAPDDEHRRYHLYRYSRREALRHLQEAGFQVVHCRRYGFLPRNVLGRLPEWLRDSDTFTRVLNCLDAALESSLPLLTQNLGIVAVRR